MVDFATLLAAVVNGITTGAIYALVALGLTLIYGVLHVINYAHGSILTLGLYAAYFSFTLLGVGPYLALPGVMALFFLLGYGLQRFVIGPVEVGADYNVLLVTMALALIINNLALYLWTSSTRTVDLPYALDVVDLGVAFVPVARLIALAAALVVAGLLWLVIARTGIGKAIRAVAHEQQGARLVGIRVEHVFAVTFGLGSACVGAAACLLLPTFYITPHAGDTFLLVAFTTVVLGGMGSFLGALLGGVLLGVVEAIGGLFLGDSLGEISIFLIFILVLLFRPLGFFGRATA